MKGNERLPKMRILICRKTFLLLSLLGTVPFFWGCTGDLMEDRSVHIDYFVMNTRSDEILVRNRDAAAGIVGFFLGSGEVYHYGYHEMMSFRTTDNDPYGIHIVLDFYAAGNDSSYTEHIGYYEFRPKLDESNACVETCFVR
jgi:hypothetical protein